MTRQPGELTDMEESLLGIERPTPEQEAEAEKQRLQKAEIERQGLTACMEQEWFRKWLMRQLMGFNTFGKTFGVSPAGFPDHPATEYHQGLCAAGWHLWCLVDDLAPELASRMRREFNKPD